MIIITRMLVGLIGLLFAFLAAGFLLNTQVQANNVGITALSVQGFATVRADIGGFFAFCGGLCLYAAATKSTRVLWPVILLIALAFAGRALSLLLNGPGEMFYVPMVAEVIIVAILYWARLLWRQSEKRFGRS